MSLDVSGSIFPKGGKRFNEFGWNSIVLLKLEKNQKKLKRHKISCYIAKVDPDFDQKAANVLDTYREAKRLNEKKGKMNKLRQ